jgi:aminoglycoside phosphotransferase (APT) family kinase protein
MIPFAGRHTSGNEAVAAEQYSPEVSLRPETVLAANGSASGEGPTVPHDPAIPGAALLCHAELRTELMSRLLAHWLGPEAQLLDSCAVPWRYVPGKRCNFQIELVIARAPGVVVERRRVVGKVYSRDQGAEVYQALQEIRNRGFARGHFLVPQPLAYDAHWKLLLLTWADGELLRSLLLGGLDVSQRIEEAAAWLLKLHHCGATTGRCYTFGRHIHTLALHKQRLAEVYPESDRLLENLLRRIEKRGGELSGWTPGPTHRDFSPDHLVFNGGHITVLDFDEFCQYDRVIDVAHFMVHLRLLGLRHFGALTRFDSLADQFQAAYQAGARDFSVARLHLYEAVAYLKLAHIVAVVQRPPAWKETVDALLREAQRLL